MKELGSSPFALARPKDWSPAGERRQRSSSFCSSLSPSPSPIATSAHHLTSIIPFSWEKKPGVPKNHADRPTSQPADPLPLPPLLRSTSSPSAPRRRRSDPRTVSPDPFAVALAECAKDHSAGDGDLVEFWRRGAAVGAGRRAAALGGRFGLAGLYGSCKTACPVADSTIRIPRAGVYGFHQNRRSS